MGDLIKYTCLGDGAFDCFRRETVNFHLTKVDSHFPMSPSLLKTKEIENQPRLKTFNLKSNLTCNKLKITFFPVMPFSLCHHHSLCVISYQATMTKEQFIVFTI